MKKKYTLAAVLKTLKFVLPLFVLLFAHAAANAQTAEQQCANMVQGKVAWNQAGDKSWSTTNVQRLCKGTTDPAGTIACFQAQIAQHNNWDRGITACQPAAVNTSPKPAVFRTVTFKQWGLFPATLLVHSGSDPQDTSLSSKSEPLAYNRQVVTQVVQVSDKIPNNKILEIEIRISKDGRGQFTAYRARTVEGDTNADLCFESLPSGYFENPAFQACNGTKVNELKKVQLRGRSMHYDFRASLKYLVNGVARSVSTGELDGNVSYGVSRSLYIPSDADYGQEIIFSVEAKNKITNNWDNLNDYPVYFDSRSALCYAIDGASSFGTPPRVRPCSIDPRARTIKFKNNGAYNAELTAVYDSPKQIRSGKLVLAGSEVQEIPRVSGSKGKTFEVYFSLDDGTRYKKFQSMQVAADFEGELCFKTAGTAINPSASTCDDMVGDATGNPDLRQIKFENNAGYDAEMVVSYFDKSIIGNAGKSMIPAMKQVRTGFIILGKSRMLVLPNDIAPGTQYQINIYGNATVKGSKPIFTTTLPADFTRFPVPCFKVWGSLFDPSGGKCN